MKSQQELNTRITALEKELAAKNRELAIEAALDRVRARTMHMQRSDELREVVHVVFEQMNNLNFDAFMCTIDLYDKATRSFEIIMSSDVQSILPKIHHIPYLDHPFHKLYVDSQEEGIPYKVFDLSGETKKTYDKLYFTLTDCKNLSEASKQMMLETESCKISSAYMSYGSFDAIGVESLSNENAIILQRFAKVFEQTYTRFLDLQKAEAQTREAEIELALERVRARTMAMHRSEEIAAILGNIFEELRLLDVVLNRILIWIFNDEKKYIEWWSANSEVENTAESYRVDYNEQPVFLTYLEAWQKRTPLLLYTLSGPTKDSWANYLFSNTGLSKLPKMVQEGMRTEGTIFTTSTISDYGLLMAGSFEPLSDENTNIIQRFGRVFQQAYTRYLDVQKAEAQAREAQIQLALERVRARTMAMQKSEELTEAANLLFQQVQTLGMRTWSAGYCILEDDKQGVTLWMSTEGIWQPPFKVPLTEEASFIRLRDAYERGETFYVEEVGGEELSMRYQYMRTRPVVGEMLDSILEAGHPLPAFQIFHYAYFSHGYLVFITYEPVPESHDIFKRFGKVFEQTYTRFLDLQKAEAQAREAQIQLALERVRARTMAMQGSDGLTDVAALLFKQVNHLGIQTWTTGFNVWSDDGNSWMDYVTSPEGGFIEPYTVDATQYPFVEVSEAKKRGDEFFIRCEKGEQLAETYRQLTKFGEKQYNAILDSGFQFPPNQYEHFVFGSKVSLMFITYEPVPEAHDIFKRFGKVFEQTYTRFLDLQKAEAQAREALIEAALEKVRSTSLAMHHLNELEKVVTVLFHKLAELGLSFSGAGIFLFAQKERNIQHWVTGLNISAPVKNDLPYDEEFEKNPIIEDLWHAKVKGEDIIDKSYSKEAKDDFFRYTSKYNDTSRIPQDVIKFVFEAEKFTLTCAAEKHALVGIDRWSDSFTPAEDFQILKRFAKVFDQAYIRFLDLQKAEAQAREAQIEAALEKVRSRSLAMHHSDELEEVVASLFARLVELGLSFDGALIFLFDKEKRKIQLWIASIQVSAAIKIELPYDKEIENNTIFKDLWNAIKNGEHILNKSYSGKTKNDYFSYVAKYNQSKYPESVRRLQIEKDSWTACFAAEKNSIIGFDSWSGHITKDEDFQILIRFARVFEQTHTRFLDLQKAEAQAREARIEAALEKIRSRSLAMQRSDELKDVVAVLFVKLKELGLVFDGGAAILLFKENSRDAAIWVVSPELSAPIYNSLPYDEAAFVDNPIILDVWKAKDTGEHILNKAYSFEEKNKYFHYVFKYNNDHTKMTEPVRKFIMGANSYTATFIAEKNSLLGANSWSGQLFSEDDIEVLKRVARVFEQAYVRFLDLQKAEAQTREAQIETALERVRARAMAMHTSEDLTDVVKELRKQIGSLGQVELDTCVIQLYDESPDYIHSYASLKPSDNNEEIRDFYRLTPKKGLLIIEESLQAYLSGQKDYILVNVKEKLKQWMSFMKQTYPDIYEVFIDTLGPKPEQVPTYWSCSDFNGGSLLMVTLAPPSEVSRTLLRRFANVFGLAYRRFVDLKHAEDSAREAKIEAAIEKVRARAMAMQKSEELRDLVSILFEELTKLDLVLARCIIWIFDPVTYGAELWMANSEDKTTADSYFIKRLDHPYYKAIIEGWKQKQLKWVYDLKGTEKKSIDQLLLNETELSKLPQAVKRGITTSEQAIVSASFNNFGFIEASGPVALTDEQMEILTRFAKVFDLTYTRFNDLKQAQISAKEAVKQAALDRIRADIASMRTVSDLNRITPLIWNELTILGVPFIRCGVFIMDDEHELIDTFLSTPDGKAIAAFHIPYDTPGNIAQVLNSWGEKKNYIAPWEEADFTEFANTLVKQGVLTSPQQYLKTLPHGGFYLHFLPFLQGMLYVGNTTRLSDEEIKLLQSVADAFSTAYARYEDFNKLEAAKQQVDKTLVDLKQAQQQLIQSEKMASLGELSAGIAHEIQNPLNFVNNFSEVNRELIAEMKEEIDKGNYDEVKLIATDVEENEQKILHHGKRADAIVKGMLQHSRVSTGEKELSDINALADEYLRLSYHGMRAKDKSFNATLQTDFDSSIGKINIVPQDIGRVFLNLFNNALHAVIEKKISSYPLKGDNDYEPMVSVITKRITSRSGYEGIEIYVKDNGIGIPQRVVDKIFQPFFTTKPTGQGTGLGLSLSYDIIKAHGGKIKVETKEGEGSEFVVHLPIS